MRFAVALSALLVAAALISAAAAHGDLPDPTFAWHDPAVLAVHKAEYSAFVEAFRAHKATVHGSRRAPLRLNNNETCGLCQVVGDVALDIFKNATDAAAAEAAVMKMCQDTFRGHDADIAVCDLLPAAAGFVLELLHNRFHFNVANILCADLLDVCKEDCCAAATATLPEQVHLSFATGQDAIGSNTTMRVSWTTLNLTGPTTAVHWAPASAPTAFATAPASWRTYAIGGWTGQLYSAAMSGLQPDTTYVYFVGDGDAPGTPRTSRLFNFTTLPLNAGSEERPLRVVGLADMGFGENGQATIDRMAAMVAAGEVDFIVHPGDIGYADGDQVWWDTFFREMEPIMSRVAYMTGPGNHECFFWNCTAYRYRFWMPQPGMPQGTTESPDPWGALYYTIDAGPVSFLMLDTESAFNTPEVTDEQVAWLEGELRARAGPNDRILFATHHRPLYCDSGSDSLLALQCTDYAQYLRGRLEGLYNRYGVSSVMVGHLHNFQRTYPVVNSTCVATNYDDVSAPMYLVNGGAGNREGNGDFTKGALDPWAAFRTLERTFMTYTVSRNAATGRITMAARTIRSSTGAVIDAFNLTKSGSPDRG